MQWIIKYLTSSIGKKQIMGCTGAILALFILGHMAGNFQLLNPDPVAAQASYNIYSELLTKSKAFLYSIELVLGVVLLTHVFLAVSLKHQNLRARGKNDYDVNARKGKKTFASFTMIWSGIFVLAFVIWHLKSLKYGEYFYYQSADVAGGAVVRDMWLTTVIAFADIKFMIFYVISMFIIGLHLFHAISSAFQTFGIAHQKWTPFIEKLGMLYSVVITIGFSVIAIGCYVLANKPETQNLIRNSRNLQQQLEQEKQQQENMKLEENAKKTSFVLPVSGVQVSFADVKGGF